MADRSRKPLDELRAIWSIARSGRVTDALFFDEQAYRTQNEDVAHSVDAGVIHDGYHHFVRYGRFEGRPFAVRTFGLSEPLAQRLCATTAGLERRIDRLVSTLRFGELSGRLESPDGAPVTRPVGPWKVPADTGPWSAELPPWARRGGWFMVKLRVDPPVRAPFAFQPLDGTGKPLGKAVALVSKPVQATQRMVRLPPGTARLQVESLEGGLRTQPLRVSLRPVPGPRVEGRLLRRLRHHHPLYVGRTEAQVMADLRATARDVGKPLRELMWREYDGTFPPPVARSAYHDWIAEVEQPELAELDEQVSERLERWTEPPLVSVLVPVYNPRKLALRECLDSVLAQSYPNWELCVVDDASTTAHVREVLDEFAARDERIRVHYREQNGHICRASNDALAMARGEYVALLDHDDILPRHALWQALEPIAAHPDTELVYGDEDKIRDNAFREHPHFKPEFDPDLLLGQNYIGHLVLARTARVREVGGFRPGFEGSQDHDLLLRLTERLAPGQIRHVPRILYHWRLSEQSTAGTTDAKPYTAVAGLRAVREALARRAGGDADHAAVPNCYRIEPPLPDPAPSVTIIVPTRDAAKLLTTCVTSLLERTDYPAFDLILVDNGSAEPDALATLERLARDPRVTVLRDDRPFNYSALNNRAVERARGDLVALVNNDIEVTQRDWLRRLVAHAVRPEIGCVGAKLVYPDDTIQHAGVVLGLHGLAGHPYKHLSKRYPGYFGRLTTTHTVSAVTFACMVMRRALYEQVGGLDERSLAVAFNDVDLCLRVREAGHRNLFVPHVTLVHHESASRGLDQEGPARERFLSEVATMKQRWSKLLYADPYYSPHLSLDFNDYSIGVRR